MSKNALPSLLKFIFLNKQKNIKLIADATNQVVFADLLFTGTSGIIQGITGLSMVYLKGYSLLSIWVFGSILGYLIAGACWLPVVWLQIRCRDLAYAALKFNETLPPIYYRYFKLWWLLAIPAFLALILVFYLMTNRPDWNITFL